MHKIKFPIGDWSDDGHGKCDYFIIDSNKPLWAVREAHFLFEENFGMEIKSICGEYEEFHLSEKWAAFIEAHLSPSSKSLYLETNKDNDEHLAMDPENVALLWCDLLMLADPELELLVSTDNMDTINFYGFDEQGRHLGTPGYGVFC